MIRMDEARRSARRAYERGRASAAITQAWVVLPMMLVALLSPTPRLQIAIGGAALFATVSLFGYVGRSLGRAVAPGLIGALVPLVVPLMLRVLGHGCSGMDCCLDGQCRTCLLVCVGAGVLAGGVIAGATASERGDGTRVMFAAAIIATMAGSLGCLVAGASGVLGMALGTAVVSTPILFWRRSA